jgi:hypothetical protein
MGQQQKQQKIALVAAPKRQRGIVCRAADQYDPSPVFRRAREYCQRHYSEWLILSVRHRLLSPHQVIGPGELTFNTLSGEERAAWIECVAAHLRARYERSADPLAFVLYTSQRHADLLMRAAPDLTFELPLSGLRLRERIEWYDERLRLQPRVLAR